MKSTAAGPDLLQRRAVRRAARVERVAGRAVRLVERLTLAPPRRSARPRARAGTTSRPGRARRAASPIRRIAGEQAGLARAVPATSSHQEQDREQPDPHDVDEVPVVADGVQAVDVAAPVGALRERGRARRASGRARRARAARGTRSSRSTSCRTRGSTPRRQPRASRRPGARGRPRRARA